MSFTEKYALWFKRLFPSPFGIAVLLTILVFLASIFYSDATTLDLLINWQQGLWETNLLAFAFQMMLMLVLGHALALSTFFDNLIKRIVAPLNSTAQAASAVIFFTILVAFLNWGLGLIFGAILARKIGEHFTKSSKILNYPLIGASGYIGLMVWHGGLSGSALSKVAESGHLKQLSGMSTVPDFVPYTETVFGSMNLLAFVLLLILLPVLGSWLGSKEPGAAAQVPWNKSVKKELKSLSGAEYVDESQYLSKTIGLLLMVLAVYIGINSPDRNLSFITPNFINFTLLSLCLLLHRNFNAFLKSVDSAIKGSAGILIQFPLYFGILALLKASGLITGISEFFIQISTEATLPIFTFISAGLVNIFVPSGGGQWAIQGPIIINAATQLNVSLPKMIMALAYGDQITNMLQPFWALPLLSITGLKAKQILPYTLLFLLVGAVIFITVLILF